MSMSLYDEAVTKLIVNRVKDRDIRVFRPEETAELFRVKADMNKDKPITLPMITISRDNTIDILETAKNPRTFDGFKLQKEQDEDILMSVIPIRLQYQLDVYCKKQSECENYIREFIFLLINNPMLKFFIPYNGVDFKQSCHIRMAPEIVDNTDTEDRLLYKGQFTKMSLTFEIDDAFLYSIPIKKNAIIDGLQVQLINDNNKVEEIVEIDE